MSYITDLADFGNLADPTTTDHNLLLNYVANEHIDWTNATQNLSTTGSLSGSNLSGTNTGDQNLFSTLTADVGANLTPPSTTSTLNFVGGTNITVTSDGVDTLTIDGAAVGESNTASNQGGFTEPFIQKTGIDLEFRTFQSTSNQVTFTQNATDIDFGVDEANIDHDSLLNFVANEHIDWTSATQNLSTSGTLGGSNYSATGSVAAGSTNSGTNTGDQDLWHTITASTGANFTPTGPTDTLNFVAGTNMTVTSNGTDTLTFDASGLGEVNTASNVGGFSEVFKQKTAIDLEFRTLQSTNGTVTITQNANDIDFIITPGTGFTEAFVSALQVITPGGALTLPHGLSGRPTMTFVVLENVTPEHNYIAGDHTPANAAVSSSSNNQGTSINPDATDLNIRFGAGSGGGTPVYSVIDKTTGATSGITNANWQAIFIAVL